MNAIRTAKVSSVIAVALLGAGCADLVPQVTTLCPPGPYAKFFVKNIGHGISGPSTTKVDGGPYSNISVNLPTPAIAGGASFEFAVDISIYGPFERRCEQDCRIGITVNSDGAAHESDRSNNYLLGYCPR